MGAVLLLIVIIIASVLCIRAGAIALELTGLAPEKARFQALSAFTNTGFTTREAEDILRVPVRRKIVSALIVLGYAGAVSVIATLATSLLAQDFLYTTLHVAVIAGAVYALYWLASLKGLTTRIGGAIRRWLLSRYDLQAPSLEEMLEVSDGFGVVRATVPEGSPLCERPLSELQFKARKVQILTIKRGNQVLSIPQGHDRLLPGDVAICYGSTAAVEEMFSDPLAGPRRPA